MSDWILKGLSVRNFRSIKGEINVPLDANVVLVHGENGSGKTSILSAVELALTGKIQSLLRADPAYSNQILFRGAANGSVSVQVEGQGRDRSFASSIDEKGVDSLSVFDEELADFFSERAFLPQALLGQLLQIYQDSSSKMDSPLAKFVGDLLGLDRLDAIEGGLQALKDVRNVRKGSEKWASVEAEIDKLKGSRENKLQYRSETDQKVSALLRELQSRLQALGVEWKPSEDDYRDQIERVLSKPFEEGLRVTIGQQRELSAIRKQIEAASGFSGPDFAAAASEAERSTREYEEWKSNHTEAIKNLEARFLALLPHSLLNDDFLDSWSQALEHLAAEKQRIEKRLKATRTDRANSLAANEIVNVANRQIEIIDDELSKISSQPESLVSLISELSGYIEDDICPVCDRDFAECGGDSLPAHVSHKVRSLSSSAERLLALGRARSEEETRLRSATRQIDESNSRLLPDTEVNALEKRLSDVQAAYIGMQEAFSVLEKGSLSRASEVTSRRRLSELQSMNTTLLATRQTLHEFARRVEVDVKSSENSSFELASYISEALDQREKADQTRASAQTRIREIKSDLSRLFAEREEQDQEIAETKRHLQISTESFERGQRLRRQASELRGIVDEVRSGIIRREFNDRLNHLWRDLFVRLAPDEPFVPAFSVPAYSTHRLQPKLITNFRNGGDAGGTPGAMLSAGNLNTAALTLFLALHLSVPKKLPWLILDDPVQSMDDVHISNFAALLRTLSKEHRRQVIIAVHDRQLFEYLRLELSPAFPEDTLLTLEMMRGEEQDTRCLAQRMSFKTDTTFGQVA